MYNLDMKNEFGICPQCSHRMFIESFRCWRCGTSVNGRIALPLLLRLPSEHLEFAEKFLLANGSLSEVQKTLDCSYPKVRRLLDETMASIRREAKAAIREKEEILKALETDRIEGKEALRLIRGLIGGEEV